MTAHDKRSGHRVKGVVMIMVDQLNANHLGVEGNSIVQTPNLDDLARQSLRFTQAHVANPTCMPNRASVFTGRWPSAHGTRTNGIALNPMNPTITDRLRAAGWSTSAAGKLHFQTMGWPFEDCERAEIEATDPALLDPDGVDAAPIVGKGGWNQYENLVAHSDRAIVMPSPYYGFDKVDLVVGHGDRPAGHYRRWAKDRGVDIDDLGGVLAGSDQLESWDEVWRSAVPAEVHHVAYTVDMAIKQVEQGAAANAATDSDEPFFVFCSFADPHHPFCPPDPYFDLHSPYDIALPATFAATHANPAPHLDFLRQQRGEPRYPTACWAPNERQLAAVLAAQYGQLAMLDDAIGRLLDAVDASGQGDEIAVVFTSDHGDMMGEHGLLLKHGVHYNAVTRVPLFVKGPNVVPGVDADLRSSVDIASTVLDWAGLHPMRGMQGQSLLPGGSSGRETVMIEEEHLFGFPGLPAPVNARTLVTSDFRLTLYASTPYGELYDRADDPDELNNLFGQPSAAAIERDLFLAMNDELIALADRGRTPDASA